ncbi:hypothetical protein, partial [Lacticaseibacillus daqingensis]|uniref:hypothetical protein n=1 Tax=Lacticaseibacillus daqingensis TaxID=2486014 RepID=UPI001CDCBA10
RRPWAISSPSGVKNFALLGKAICRLQKQISPLFSYLRSQDQLFSLLLDPNRGDVAFPGKLTATIKAS